MASFSLPPSHPFANVRPGYAGFESTPPGSIVNVTSSYIGAAGDYANNNITLNLYSTTGGTWNVATPAGLTLVTSPTSNAQTTIVYNGGIRSTTYTFNSITLTNGQGTTITWTGPTPSVTLTVPPQSATITNGYYDQSYIYITASSAQSLGALIPGITDYYVKCSNNTSYVGVDTVNTALIPYPTGTTFSPGSTTPLIFTAACRSNGILGQTSTAYTVNILQPASPTVTITAVQTNITLTWTGTTANSIASISYGGGIIASNVTSPYAYTVSTPGNYSFQVISTLCGLSTYSSVANIQVAPTQPAGVTATVTGLSVNLNWTSPVGNGYSYTVSGDGTTSVQTVNTNTATFPTVAVGSQIFHITSIYSGIYSTTCNITVNVTTTPPYNLTTSTYGSTVTVNWNNSTPGATFNVSNTFNNTTTGVTATTYSLASIPLGTYTFYVTSISQSIPSTSASITGTVTLAGPQNFTVTTLDSTATLNWTESTQGSSFDICYGISPPYNYISAASGTTSTTIPNLAAGSYSFFIRSSLPGGSTSSYSSSNGVIVVAKPTNFVVSSTGSIINFSWSEVTSGCSFLISNIGNGSNYTTTSTTYSSNTGNAFGSCNFTLVASNTSSFKSATVNSATIYVLATPAPTATKTDSSITVTWPAITYANSYTITSSPTGLTDPAPSSSITATYTNVPPGTYTFSVVATDANGDTSSAGTTGSVSVPVPAPTNFSAVMSTSSTVYFTWDEANTNVIAFTISPIPSGTTLIRNGKTASLTNFPNSGNYSFTVSAGYGTLTSPASSSINVYGFPTLSNAITASCSLVNGVYAATVSNVISTDQWSHYPDGTNLNTTGGSSSNVVVQYSGNVNPPPISSGTAGNYYAEFYSQKTYISNTISSSFPFYVKPPSISSVTASGGSITVNWNDSDKGSCTYSVQSSDGTFSSNSITAGTKTVTFNNASIGSNYIFTVSSSFSSNSNFTRKFIRSSDGSNVTQDTISIPYTIYAPSLTSNVTPLAAPTGLIASASGTTITVSWNTVTNATTYYVYTSTGSNNVGNVTTCKYTGTVGTQESIQVQSFSNNVASNITSVFNVTPTSTPVITSIVQSGSTITVTCASTVYGTLSINTPTGLTLTNPQFTFTGASADKQYFFTISSTGTSSTSINSSNFTTINTPTNVTATANGTSTITVNWSYPASSLVTPISYAIWVNGYSNGSVNHPTTTYTYNQTSGTTYSNYVVAVSPSHTSIPSSTVVVTDLTTAATVSTPNAIGSNFYITFTYPSSSTNISNFKVYDSSSTLYTTIPFSPPTTTVGGNNKYVYTTPPITIGSYSFYVVTTDNYGSTISSSTTTSVTSISAPTINSILQNGGNINVSCAAPSAGITLTCSTPTGLTSVSTNNNLFVFSGAVQNTNYSFTVTATGTNATSSSNSNITTLYTPTLQTVTASGTTVTVNWNYSGLLNGIKFTFYNACQTISYAVVSGLTTTTSSFTGTVGTTYDIVITATDSNGNVSIASTVPYIPTSPPLTNCVLWLDGADPNGNGIVPSDGSGLSAWVDKSGSGISLLSSGANNPPYSSSLKAVQFLGSSQQFTIPDTIKNSIINSSFTIFLISQRVNNNENFIFRGSAQATNQNLLIGYEPYGSPSGWRFTFYGNDLDTSLPAYTSGEPPTLSCFMYSTSTSYKYSFLSGSIGASGSQSSVPLSSWAGAIIGGTPGVLWGALYANVYEVLIYSSALTTSQRQQTEGYLAWKWGLQRNLPSGHPFYNVPPTSYTFSFVPNTIPGCQLWLDAADPTTVTGTTNVTQWTDKSGNGNNATNGSSVTYANNTVSFKNTSSTLYLNVPHNYATSGGTIVFVGKPLGNNGSWRTLIRGYANDHHIIMNPNGTQIGSYITATGTAFQQFDSYTNDGTQRMLFFVNISKSGLFSGSKNGDLNLSSVAYATTSLSDTYYGLGNYPYGGGGQPWGDLNEILIYNTTLTTTQRQQVEGYLAWKWGLQGSLPNNHPYYNSPPLSYTDNPTNVPGCKLWVDAADPNANGILPYNNTSITTWVDKSGTANNMSITGQTVTCVLNQGSSYLNFPSGAIATTANTINITANTTVFVVYQVTDPSTFNMIVAFPGLSGGDFSIRGFLNRLNNDNINDFVNGNGYYVNGTLINTRPNFVIPSGFNIVDGLNAGVYSGNTYVTMSSSFFSRYFIGYIKELIIYTSSITSSQRQEIEKYLEYKWGIGYPTNITTPISTPTISSVVIYAGNATVYIGSVPSPAIISGVNISSDLTLVSQTTSQIVYSGVVSGTTYSFAIQASYGSATSTSSTVTSTALYTPGTPSITAIGSTITISWTYGDNTTSVSGITFYVYNGTSLLKTVTGSKTLIYSNLNVGGSPAPTSFAIYVTATDGTNTSISSATTNLNTFEVPIISQNYNRTTSNTIVANVTTTVGQPSFTALTDSTSVLVPSVNGSTVTWTNGVADTLYTGIIVNANDGNATETTSTNLVTAFDPTSIPGCKLWLDSVDPNGDGTVPSDGSTITSWKDKSGTGNHGTATGTPIYKTNGMNTGYPSIYFNGSSWFRGSVNISNNGISVFIVIKMTQPTSVNSRIVSLSVPGSADYDSPLYFLPFYQRYNTPYYIFDSYRATGIYAYGVNCGGAPTIGTNINDGYKTYLYKNGSLLTSVPSGGIFGITAYGIGNYAGGQSEPFTGYLSEILIYTGGLSPLQRESVEGYLAWKWGLQGSLTSTLPFSYYFPANVKSGTANYSPVVWYDASVPNSLVTSGTSGSGSLNVYLTTNSQALTMNGSISSLSQLVGGTCIMNGAYIGGVNYPGFLAPSGSSSKWYAYVTDNTYCKIVSINFSVTNGTLSANAIGARYSTTFMNFLYAGSSNDVIYNNASVQDFVTSSTGAGYGVASFTINFAASVSKWKNQGTNGSTNDAVAASGYTQAAYLTTENALYFNNSLYSTNYTATPSYETVFIVFKTAGAYHSALLSGSDYYRSIAIGEGSSGAFCVSYVAWLQDFYAQTPVYSLIPNKINVLVGYSNPTSTNIGINGYTIYPGGLPWPSGSSTTSLGGQAAGNQGSPNDYYIGYVYEILIFNYQLNSQEIKSIEGYLNLKWNAKS